MMDLGNSHVWIVWANEFQAWPAHVRGDWGGPFRPLPTAAGGSGGTKANAAAVLGTTTSDERPAILSNFEFAQYTHAYA